ncbi:MAG: hypothetical protein JO256_11800 [Alphaproteobacteria bacterium]|nr:hypothetical protein [Alphaproteobacteria bacterium]
MSFRLLPKWLPFAAFLFAGANFVASIYLPSILGGDAYAGYEAAGHYFLKFKMEPAVEVSRTTFEFVWWHERSVPVMLVLAVLLIFVVGYQHRPKP